jgi:DNA-directed RNA polymerase specialized sigma24 family protein
VDRRNLAVGYGYTLNNLDRLARAAMLRSRAGGWAAGTDPDERYATAWHAIAAYLYQADTAPTAYELIGQALAALQRDHDEFRHDHGWRDNARAFGVFWLDTAAATPGPEHRIIERAALTQIWPQLQPYQQRALTALATFESYQQAADALGLSYKTFASTISQARRRFLELWHEGEEPSRPWGNDRRRSEGTRRNAVTRHVKYRKGRRKVEPVHGRPSTYRNHRCRCTPCRQAARLDRQAYRASRGRAVSDTTRQEVPC